jgi:hypothetical protein
VGSSPTGPTLPRQFRLRILPQAQLRHSYGFTRVVWTPGPDQTPSFAQQFSFDRALSALRNGRVKTEGMISKRFTLDAYDEALAAVADSSVVKALIVP